MPDQAMAVHKELVAFGLATEYRMIVEHKAVFPVAGVAVKDERGRESADSPTDDDTVVDFSSLDNIFGNVLKLSVTDSMTGFKHRLSVAVRIRVIAHASVACPVI